MQVIRDKIEHVQGKAWNCRASLCEVFNLSRIQGLKWRWKWKFWIHPSDLCKALLLWYIKRPDVWTPTTNRIQLHLPKRIKSAAHLIVNCNIKPNGIPITIHWIGVWNLTALFFPTDRRQVFFLSFSSSFFSSF